MAGPLPASAAVGGWAAGGATVAVDGLPVCAGDGDVFAGAGAGSAATAGLAGAGAAATGGLAVAGLAGAGLAAGAFFGGFALSEKASNTDSLSGPRVITAQINGFFSKTTGK